MAKVLRVVLLAFLVLYVAPLVAHAIVMQTRDRAGSWSSADWSSAGLLPKETAGPALVRIYAAPTGRWRGIFAVHTWVVVKPAGGGYDRYDKVGWGTPIRRNAYAPDARWFGEVPEVVFAADGEAAERLIPKIRAAVASYPFARAGQYRAWPGPNSNTFAAHVMASVPEIATPMPANAIGKDFPTDGSWIGRPPSGTGVRISLGGYLGFTASWVEGLELDILGAVAGLDLRRPGIKLPGFGRIGI